MSKDTDAAKRHDNQYSSQAPSTRDCGQSRPKNAGGGGQAKPRKRSRRNRRKGKKPRPRPAIDASQQDLTTITDQAWKALIGANSPPKLFRRGGEMIRVEKGDDGQPILRTVTQDRMRYRLAEVADWYKPGKDAEAVSRPSIYVVRNVLATPNPNLPVLDGVGEVPVYGTDTSLSLKPGYHPASRLFYAPPKGFKLPTYPRNPHKRTSIRQGLSSSTTCSLIFHLSMMRIGVTRWLCCFCRWYAT